MVALSTLAGVEHPAQLRQASSTKERWLVLIPAHQVEEATTNACQRIPDMDTRLLGCIQV